MCYEFLVEVVVMSGPIVFGALSCAASNLLGNAMNRGRSIALCSKSHFDTSDAIWLQATFMSVVFGRAARGLDHAASKRVAKVTQNAPMRALKETLRDTQCDPKVTHRDPKVTHGGSKGAPGCTKGATRIPR